MDDLLQEQADLQEAIETSNGWELERTLEVAADALRIPPWMTRSVFFQGVKDDGLHCVDYCLRV